MVILPKMRRARSNDELPVYRESGQVLLRQFNYEEFGGRSVGLVDAIVPSFPEAVIN